MLTTIGAMLILMSGLVAGTMAGPQAETLHAKSVGMPAYVGSESCSACHESQVAEWRDSHHGWALRAADAANILGDFDDAIFEHGGVRTRFFRRNGQAFVETDGPDGAPTAYEIKYTVGVEPLQQYLVELDKGRLQVLDIAWDVARKRWYHLYPDQEPRPGIGLHWTGPYKNWQARCAGCHQTNFIKGYDPNARAYNSTWSDLNVACESCHGLGEAHVVWARDPDGFYAAGFEGVDEKGLTVAFGKPTAEAEIQLCAACHARREPLGANSSPPGAPFADHYNLANLRDGLYHADGQIKDEVYVYGSFLQSKMYARGVRCTNCHDPHSLKLVAEGNAICTQCHNSAGNPDYPTLKPAEFDTPEHHHHQPGTAGAQCANCHMPAKKYMVIDARRDHGFRIPRPDLSARLGTANPCAGCHQDKNALWAADQVKQWYPDGRSGRPHYADDFTAARGGDTSAGMRDRLIAVALDRQRPAIVRASALDLLRPTADQWVIAKVAPLLKDTSDLIRTATVRLFRETPGEVRFRWLGPLVSDQRRTVRIAAARELLNIPPARFPEADRRKIAAAIREYQQSLLAKSDYPETQMRIAGLALVLRNTKAAQGALKTALSMDPEIGDAWLLLSRVLLAERRLDAARETLEQGIKHLPDAGSLYHSLGNVLVRQGRDSQALTPLAMASELMPRDVGVHIDLAAALTRLNQHIKASGVIESARKLAPDNPTILALLATNQLNRGRLVEARDTVRELVRRYPRYQLTSRLRALLELPQ